MRYQVNVPVNQIPAAAGSSIHVFEAGTTNHVAQTLYADSMSGATLSNPYAHPGGKVSFYLPQPVKVSIGVQAVGAAAPVVAPAVIASSRAFAYSALRLAGGVVGWVLG